MARKSKAKKSKAKSKSKKTTRKSKKPKKVSGALTPKIGVISTIRVPQALRQAFRAGLNDPSVTFDVVQVRSYRRAKLKCAIDDFNADDTIGLIMTVGGLIAFQAANALSTKPFISLVGVKPPDTTLSPKCMGGVTLQSFQINPDRIQHLAGKGYQASEIALFRNPNSAMANAEEAAWTGAQPVISGGSDANGDNDASTYPAAFAGIPAAIRAVVISADPFFLETKDDLITAANSTGKYVCFPLQDYDDGSVRPTATKTTLYGPALVEPFTLLGERASRVLDTGTRLVPSFVSVPETIKDL